MLCTGIKVAKIEKSVLVTITELIIFTKMSNLHCAIYDLDLINIFSLHNIYNECTFTALHKYNSTSVSSQKVVTRHFKILELHILP